MLNFISSPIGNLNDISLRSINVLKNSDYIFSEDTRVSSKLLNFAKINKKARGGKVAFFGGKRCYNQNNDDNRTH